MTEKEDIVDIVGEESLDKFFKEDELPDEMYEKLYDYYVNTPEMPYGTKKARTGDPRQWIYDRIMRIFSYLSAECGIKIVLPGNTFSM